MKPQLNKSPKMPIIFVGHGNPMNAIQENEFVDGFGKLAKELPHPKAVLCISAHWFIRGTRFTAMEKPKTIHDFYGFPKALYDVQYPANGDPELAEESRQLVVPTVSELDQDWGLDHGTWSVLKHMYPEADIPVIQMSIDYTKPAEYHFDLAKRLAPLREKGVLIIGSGNIVHNLSLVNFPNMNKANYGYDWAVEARSTINDYLLDENFQPLIDYDKQGKAMHLAVPTPDHYLPMIYILGLKQKNEQIKLFNDKLVGGSLSMTSFMIR